MYLEHVLISGVQNSQACYLCKLHQFSLFLVWRMIPYFLLARLQDGKPAVNRQPGFRRGTRRAGPHRNTHHSRKTSTQRHKQETQTKTTGLHHKQTNERTRTNEGTNEQQNEKKQGMKETKKESKESRRTHEYPIGRRDFTYG